MLFVDAGNEAALRVCAINIWALMKLWFPKIVSDIELIPMQKINEAWDRLLKQDVRYRFVIDMASLKS
jgi:D-arabinose 1-dehydrogenase-like Zn-dependent alcohol dehydrogenase